MDEVDIDDVEDVCDVDIGDVDVGGAGDICHVDEIDVDDVSDVRHVGDFVKMKWTVEFGSSSFEKTIRKNCWEYVYIRIYIIYII